MQQIECWTYLSDVSEVSWQPTQAERCLMILESWLGLGLLLGWRLWLRPLSAAYTVPLQSSIEGDQVHIQSKTPRVSEFWVEV